MCGYKILTACVVIALLAGCTPVEGSWPWARPKPAPAAVPPETRYQNAGPDVIAVPVMPVVREGL